MKNLFKRTVMVCVTAASLFFIVSVLISQWSEIGNRLHPVSVIEFVVLAVPLYLVTSLLVALAWVVAFRTVGGDLPFGTGLRIHLVSQAGKYFPGNVGHFVGRIGLLKVEGYSVKAASASVVLEVLWLVGAAAFLSVYALFVGAMDTIGGEVRIDLSGPWMMLVAVVAVLLPNVMVALFNTLPPRLREKLGYGGKVSYPPQRSVLSCYFLYFLSFFFNGLIIVGGFYFLFDSYAGSLPLVVSVYAGVWLLGFVLPGAPGGIGVREALFVLLFGPVYGVGPAAALGVVVRFVSVLGDLLALGLGLLLSRLSQRSDSAG